LARKTRLTIPSISRLAEALLKDGLILAEEKVMMGRMGQPSLPLVLAPRPLLRSVWPCGPTA
jgi:hypothetical protein